MVARRIHRKRKLTLLLTLSLLATMIAVMPGAFASHALNFELDGNTLVNSTVDWETFYDGSGPGGNIALVGSSANYIPGEPKADHALPDTTTFTQGSKDTLDIKNGGWTCTRSNNVNNKVDIINAYSAGYRDSHGDLYIYFGMEIRAPEGNSNVGIWFLEDDRVGCERTGGGSQPFAGEHRVGDILLVAAFTNGGTVANVTAYEWVGSGGSHGALDQFSGTGGRCDQAPLSDTNFMCAITNNVNITTPWNSPTRSGGALEANQFFEGAINITKAFPGGDECFTRFLANTRSSQSLTATLFDFTTGELPVCGGLTVEKVTDPAGVNQNFNFSISGPGANELFALNASQASTAKKSFTGIVAGNYTVTETIPGGWDLVDVTCKDNGNTVGTTPVMDSGTQIGVTVPVGVSDNITCTFTNRLRHSILILKRENGATGPLLAGASFRISGPSGSNLLLTENPTGVHCLDNLLPGTYTVSETQPPGYQPVTVNPITTSSTLTCAQRRGTSENPPANSDADVVVVNEPAPVNLTVQKRKISIDSSLNLVTTTTPLQNFQFTLYEGSDNTGTQVGSPVTTAANGNASFPAGVLQVGTTYTLCETGVPSGQTNHWTAPLDPANSFTVQQCQTFTAALNTNVTRTFHNAPRADVSITFTDVTTFTNAVITCTGASGNPFTFSQQQQSFSTTGTLNLNQLNLGKYTCVIEIKNGS